MPTKLIGRVLTNGLALFLLFGGQTSAQTAADVSIKVPVDIKQVHQDVERVEVECRLTLSSPDESIYLEKKVIDASSGAYNGIFLVSHTFSIQSQRDRLAGATCILRFCGPGPTVAGVRFPNCKVPTSSAGITGAPKIWYQAKPGTPLRTVVNVRFQ